MTTSDNTLPSISLYFKEGASDKVYHAQIKARGDGFVVEFQYGRRGSSLTAGSKTPEPIAYDKAMKVYEKIVKEKTGKGYTPDEGGAVYQSTENAGRATGLRPQLLTPITRQGMMALLRDPQAADSWVVQQKHDGERRFVQRSANGVIGANRKSLEVAIPMQIVDAAQKSKVTFTLDTEIIGETVYAFDILELDGDDLRSRPYWQRLNALVEAFKHIGENEHIRLVYTAQNNAEKIDLIEMAEGSLMEGVVLKNLDAPYAPGRQISQYKFKFIESSTVEVLAVNEGKRSVQLQVYDESGRSIPVGNVTIPPNQGIPKAGDVVEVQYLYAYENGSLFQPVYKGVRADQDSSACTADQLKYKVEHMDIAPVATREPSRPRA